ncbi:MAG TPA: TetR family transcriptional regulator C-terminal domain-containing protein [Brevibacterium sp.]|nr:TetR family transcriptional regulator C-terminal domain-containing protein [Brevibacterium sp.]
MATRSKDMRERDARVIAAAWRLIAREGLGALTVKALAGEAGVAASSMLYTMPSHAVVRERALEAIAPAIRQRVSGLPAEPAEGPERARMLLEALLPLDAERRLEASVLQVLSASALTESGLQPIWREVDGTIRDVCAQALRARGIRGDVVALDHLHTLTSGLINQLMNRGEDRSLQWVHAVLNLELQRKIEAT